MSDNKKYYYIKLKENYFERDNVKILEAQENGFVYSLIILKLYLKSCKYDGCLMMTDRIPYNPEKLDILAKVLNHDVAHIKDALSYAKELDLITIVESGEIWMTDIQNFIGLSSTEADRIRNYRNKISDKEKESVQMYDKCTPELEIELKKEIKIKKEYNPDYIRLAKYLIKHIENNDDKHFVNKDKHKIVNLWYDSIRLLVEKDGREVLTIKNVIEWCQQDPFWKTNILSASKLRKQFPSLLMKVKELQPKTIEQEMKVDDTYDPTGRLARERNNAV